MPISPRRCGYDARSGNNSSIRCWGIAGDVRHHLLAPALGISATRLLPLVRRLHEGGLGRPVHHRALEVSTALAWISADKGMRLDSSSCQMDPIGKTSCIIIQSNGNAGASLVQPRSWRDLQAVFSPFHTKSLEPRNRFFLPDDRMPPIVSHPGQCRTAFRHSFRRAA
jgi:hypothetical protein